MKLLSFLLLIMLAAVAKAQYTYTNNGGTITITKFTGVVSTLSIPSTINGLTVTGIGNGVFGSDPDLISVTIPNTVTNIGSQAFWNCVSLASVTIGNRVASIGEGAFQFCFDLTSATLPQSITSIGSYAFNGCSLTAVAIPTNVMSIGDQAFLGCSRTLTSVTIPANVTNIGVAPFAGCANLTAIKVATNNPAYCSVAGVLFNGSQTMLIQCPGGEGGYYSVPDSVTNIGGYSFYGCDYLNGVSIPNATIGIGDSAFGSCPNLTAITVATNNPAYCSVAGVLFNSGQTTLIQCPGEKGGYYSVPDSVTNIDGYAFYGCTGLTGITLSRNLISIQEYTFFQCTGLASIVIPNAVTSIGKYAFFDCETMENVTIGGRVTSIGALAFSDCTSLASVIIPGSVVSIGEDAFDDCTLLTAVYFQGNAPTMDSTVFSPDNFPTNKTAYFIPGTKYWGGSNGGLPTKQWLLPNPLILESQPSFGFKTNKFGFTISWATNVSVVVQSSPSLVNPGWRPIETNTLNGGTSYFSDAQWTNYPVRFYRVVSQ